MRRLFLVSMATLMSYCMAAQTGTITGLVTDKASGEEIPMANIWVKNSEART